MPARLICQCGGEVPRPMPPKCPHCGRIIGSVRRPRGAWVGPAVVVISFFGLLLLGVLALVKWFGS